MPNATAHGFLCSWLIIRSTCPPHTGTQGRRQSVQALQGTWSTSALLRLTAVDDHHPLPHPSHPLHHPNTQGCFGGLPATKTPPADDLEGCQPRAAHPVRERGLLVVGECCVITLLSHTTNTGGSRGAGDGVQEPTSQVCDWVVRLGGCVLFFCTPPPSSLTHRPLPRWPPHPLWWQRPLLRWSSAPPPPPRPSLGTASTL